MSFENETNQFISWGAGLGIPMNKMPDQNAIRSMFKNSRESTLFLNLMQKIRPHQDVEIVRKNILVSKLDKLKNQLIPISQRPFTPEEMQRYLKMEDLLKEKAEVDANLKEAKERCNLNAIKMKNVQKINMIHKRENLRTKVTILQLKSDSLTVKKQKELDNQKKILGAMPIKFHVFTSYETIANQAVSQALKELNEFYKTSSSPSKYPTKIIDSKNELWEKLRTIFAKIPNSVIWNDVVRIKDEQIQHIKDLNNSSSSNFVNFNFQNLTRFDTQLFKAKASIISLVSNYVKLLHEDNELGNDFRVASNAFEAELRNKLNIFYKENDNQSEDIKQLLSDFMYQYNTRIFYKARNDILIAEIERYKIMSEEGRRNLEHHPVSITSLKEIYSDTEILIQRVQQEISQLSDIKDKIRYSKGLLESMLKNIQNFKHQNSGESFNLDGVLCSTKLDFDATTLSNFSIRSENTTIIGNNAFVVPATISNELTLFNETPIENFKILVKPAVFHLRPNPIILSSSEISTLQFCPHALLTAEGSLQYIKNQVEWYAKMKSLSNELEPNIQIDQINFDELKLINKKQYEDVIQILDKIKVCGIKSNRTISKAFKYYQFVLSNCLKDFIPNTKLFNNQSYADYESEYTMYYRMATSGLIAKPQVFK